MSEQPDPGKRKHTDAAAHQTPPPPAATAFEPLTATQAAEFMATTPLHRRTTPPDPPEPAPTEQRILHLVRAARAAAGDMLSNPAMLGQHYALLDRARDDATDHAEPQLTSATIDEWHHAESDLMRHCDAIEAHTLAAQVARQRHAESDDEDDNALNYCGALASGANYLVQHHAQELHRLVLALHHLATQPEPPTADQIRQARLPALFNHDLPGGTDA